MAVLDRGQPIRGGNDISDGVEKDQGFARHGNHACRRLATVGVVYGIVRSVTTGQPTIAEPRRR